MTRKRKQRGPGKAKVERAEPIPASKNAVPPTSETVVKLPPPFLDKLAPELRLAAIKINAAFNMRCKHLAFKVSKTKAIKVDEQYSPLLQAMSAEEIEEMRDKLDSDYAAWCDEMRRRRLGISPVLRMIVEAVHPYEIDRIGKRASGWASQLLIEALGVYPKTSRTTTY